MVSACILNWKRPENVEKIVKGLSESDLVDEILVWNNNPVALSLGFFDRPEVKVINCSHDMSLFTRFTSALLCKNDAILVIDDDVSIDAVEVERLYDHWLNGQESLHGKFGRSPRKKKNTYGKAEQGASGVCPIVLTRLVMFDKQLAARFFQALPRFLPFMKDAIPEGNGEDIILSYVAMKHSGEMNKVHDIKVKELPDPYAIHHRWTGHEKHRTTIMRECQKWLTE